MKSSKFGLIAVLLALVLISASCIGGKTTTLTATKINMSTVTSTQTVPTAVVVTVTSPAVTQTQISTATVTLPPATSTLPPVTHTATATLTQTATETVTSPPVTVTTTKTITTTYIPTVANSVTASVATGFGISSEVLTASPAYLKIMFSNTASVSFSAVTVRVNFTTNITSPTLTTIVGSIAWVVTPTASPNYYYAMTTALVPTGDSVKTIELGGTGTLVGKYIGELSVVVS